MNMPHQEQQEARPVLIQQKQNWLDQHWSILKNLSRIFENYHSTKLAKNQFETQRDLDNEAMLTKGNELEVINKEIESLKQRLEALKTQLEITNEIDALQEQLNRKQNKKNILTNDLREIRNQIAAGEELLKNHQLAELKSNMKIQHVGVSSRILALIDHLETCECTRGCRQFITGQNSLVESAEQFLEKYQQKIELYNDEDLNEQLNELVGMIEQYRAKAREILNRRGSN